MSSRLLCEWDTPRLDHKWVAPLLANMYLALQQTFMDPLSIIIRYRGLWDFFNKQIICPRLGQMLSKGQATQRKASCSVWVGTRLGYARYLMAAEYQMHRSEKQSGQAGTLKEGTLFPKQLLVWHLVFTEPLGAFNADNTFLCTDKHPSSSMRVRLALH